LDRELPIIPSEAMKATIGGNTASLRSLGTLRIKMRMRKPLKEAMRYTTDMKEVKDTTMASMTKKGMPGSDFT
jgi:hypothetical protein